MIEDLKKSIGSTLYERVSSPFYGALFISWSICNWKLFYVTFFIKGEELDGNKIEWIQNNSTDIHQLVTYPFLSALFILTIAPFATNAAYYINLKFNKWRMDKKHTVEMSTLLTREQSIKIREDIAEAEKRMNKLLDHKNQEINSLTLQVDDLKNRKEESKVMVPSITSDNFTIGGDEIVTTSKLAKVIINNPSLKRTLDTAIRYAQGGFEGLIGDADVSSEDLGYLEVNHLIKNEAGVYILTDFGRDTMKIVLDSKFKN